MNALKRKGEVIQSPPNNQNIEARQQENIVKGFTLQALPCVRCDYFKIVALPLGRLRKICTLSGEHLNGLNIVECPLK